MADDLLLDDPAAVLAGDPGLMLHAVASSGAQVRVGLADVDHDVLNVLSAEGRPRALVICGMGGSGIAGAALAAIAQRRSPVPVIALSDYQLPGWVGAVDVVVAVSCSGGTEETIASATEAVRRGCRLVAVGAAGSPLHEIALAAPGALFLAVDAQGRMPRASLWTLLTPVLLAAEALGVVAGAAVALPEVADRLDAVSLRCGVDVPLEVNEAKSLGIALAESLPLVWGSGELGAVAAYRLGCQLNENAKLPAVIGSLPEATHNQVVALDAPGLDSGDVLDDIFRDRVSDPDPTTRLRLILVRDQLEHPQVARRADIARDLAERRGIAVSTVRADDGPSVARFADLVGVIDWATVYAALSLGVDPSPIGPIIEMKSRLST